MKPPALPEYQIRSRREHGAPYTRHSIIVAGQVIYTALQPLSEAEIVERIRSHMNPPPPVPVKEFMAKSGPKPKKAATVQANGFIWKEPEE